MVNDLELKNLRILANAFKDYKAEGKTLEEFEKDFDCMVNFNDFGYITSIMCNNNSTKTMMKLKYE